MKCFRVCAYLLIMVCLAAHAAFAARPPANATYYVVAIGIDQAYGTRAECFTFTSGGLCSLDGEICGSWQPLDTTGNETSFAFDLVAPGENRPVKLQGIARVDTRGKKSSIGGAGRVTGLGPASNFSFSGRQTSVNRCVNLLADFEGDDQDVADGSGDLATETREVAGFSRVVLSGVGRLIINHTGEESLRITAEDNILPLLQSEVVGDSLILGPAPNTSINSTKTITYRLNVITLKGLDVSGVTVVDVTGIDTSVFKVNVTGVSNVEVAGAVDRQEVTTSGTSAYLARDLSSRIAEVNVTGLSRAVLRVSERITGVVSGFGVLDYFGNPAVQVTVSGFAEVNRLGN
jgi:hypothetical protein